MAGTRQTAARVLERGDIFFFYRPDAGQDAPEGLLDVRRFHVVLRPAGKDQIRLITVGRKTLPDAGGGDDGGGRDRTHWAFVERVFDDPEGLRAMLAGGDAGAEDRGGRPLPPARPAGEGVYALVRHGRDTQLAYVLELPRKPGAVQRAFHIEPEGRYVLSVKNPQAPSPEGVGLDDGQRPAFPEELMERFGSRKWSPADPPDFLDHEGAELVLIAGRDRVGAADELGIELDPQPEDEDSAEVFRDLRLENTGRNLKPLFEGTWE